MHSSDQMWTNFVALIDGLIEDRPTLDDGMNRLLAYCREAAPEFDTVWDQIASLDFAQDQSALTEWVTQLFAAEPPAATVNGLWFGLFNPSNEDEQSEIEELSQLYMTGSASFDPSQPYGEWPCHPVYLPEDRYADSQVLPAIYLAVAATGEEDLFPLGEPILGYGYVALTLIQWMRDPEIAPRLLGDAKQRAVAFGHDGGDRFIAGVLGESQ